MSSQLRDYDEQPGEIRSICGWKGANEKERRGSRNGSLHSGCPITIIDASFQQWLRKGAWEAVQAIGLALNVSVYVVLRTKGRIVTTRPTYTHNLSQDRISPGL